MSSCGFHPSQLTSVATVGLNVPAYLEGPVEAAQQGWVDVHTFATDVLAPGATPTHPTSTEHPYVMISICDALSVVFFNAKCVAKLICH